MWFIEMNPYRLCHEKRMKAIICISILLSLSACSATYKIPTGDNVALLQLDIKEQELKQLSFYRYVKAKGNEVDVFLFAQERKFKPNLFLISANKKVRLSFHYSFNYFDYCEQYIEFYPKSSATYKIQFNTRIAKNQDYPLLTMQHDCDFKIMEGNKEINTYKHPQIINE